MSPPRIFADCWYTQCLIEYIQAVGSSPKRIFTHVRLEEGKAKLSFTPTFITPSGKSCIELLPSFTISVHLITSPLGSLKSLLQLFAGRSTRAFPAGNGRFKHVNSTSQINPFSTHLPSQQMKV